MPAMLTLNFAHLGGVPMWEWVERPPSAFESWVAAATRPDGACTARPTVAGQPLPDGYGYQWWLMPGTRGDYAAIGVYNQYVYVDPDRQAVVVRLAANPRYGTTPDHSGDEDEASIKFMRAAVDQLTA